MLIVFAYVDIFGFYRADVLQAALDGRVGTTGLAVNQTFLTLTTLYIVIPALMVVLSLLLSRRLGRFLQVVVSMLYIVSIGVSVIGEDWVYFLLGSAIEVVLLVAIAWSAWTWPRPAEDLDAPGLTGTAAPVDALK